MPIALRLRYILFGGVGVQLVRIRWEPWKALASAELLEYIPLGGVGVGTPQPPLLCCCCHDRCFAVGKGILPWLTITMLWTPSS